MKERGPGVVDGLDGEDHGWTQRGDKDNGLGRGTKS